MNDPYDTTTKSPRAAGRRAFSLLEIMLAIGVLGIGLIMISAMFPVAIVQHREGLVQARATELASKARSIIMSRCDGVQLWVDPRLTFPNYNVLIGGGSSPSLLLGRDSPWYMLPMANLVSGADFWDSMPSNAPAAGGEAYADGISGFLTSYRNPVTFNQLANADRRIIFSGVDILSDRFGAGSTMNPFTDAQFQEATNRFVWIGFYRWLSTGSYKFAAAICKLSRNDTFAEQDLSAGPAGARAISPSIGTRRLPVPWRVTVAYLGGHRLSNQAFTPGAALGDLAPAGSKVMISGWSSGGDPPSPPVVPTGRVLTVSSVFDDAGAFTSTPGQAQYAVDVLEDVSDLPYGVEFDLWILPPPVVPGTANVRFGPESPLVEWKINL